MLLQKRVSQKHMCFNNVFSQIGISEDFYNQNEIHDQVACEKSMCTKNLLFNIYIQIFNTVYEVKIKTFSKRAYHLKIHFK